MQRFNDIGSEWSFRTSKVSEESTQNAIPGTMPGEIMFGLMILPDPAGGRMLGAHGFTAWLSRIFHSNRDLRHEVLRKIVSRVLTSFSVLVSVCFIRSFVST
jgi:hypothetical protein